jgi:esterase/lipase
MKIDALKLLRTNPYKWLAFLFLVVALGLILGPKNSFGPNVPSRIPGVPTDLQKLDEWLAQQEASVPHLRSETAKEVVWASGRPIKTKWSVVYIHGFSASKLETAPLSAEVGKALGANVFYTRLSGHGQSGLELGEASVQDWLADIYEAVDIGKLIGEQVLVISCSTGSTLATWFAVSDRASDVYAHVFISPNFGPKDKRAEMINWPWGHQLAFAIQGPTRGELSKDPRQNMGWTTVYPTEALFPMMALTKEVRESELSKFKQPVLVFFSQDDQVVEPEEIKTAFNAFGSSSKKLVKVDYSLSTNQHVLAGNVYDPNAVAPMVKEISNWLH